MIRLDSTRSLQALLGGAVATTELPITVSYSDKTTDTYNGAAQLSTTTGATPVIIAAAPAVGVVRDVDYISVRNVDTASATITIRYSTPHSIVAATLAVGDHLVFVHGDGWRVFDASGALKTVLTMDHGLLTGLADDDHLQYHTDARALTWLGTRSTTDLAEGTRLYFTDERAQDAVGIALVDSATIDFTYDDAGNTITAVVKADSISNTLLADVATQTFKGRNTAATGDPEDLSTATAKTMLNLTGTNSGDQTITLTGDVTGSGTGSFAATIAGDVVTYAKMQNVSATNRVLGRSTVGAGDPEEITVGGDITQSGSIFTVANDAVTNAKAADMATNTMKARVTAATGDPEDVAVAANQFLARSSTGQLAAKALTDAALAVLAGGDQAVADGGTGRSSHTAFSVLCGGTTTTDAQQSVASVGTTGQVLTSAGAGALPTFANASGGLSAATQAEMEAAASLTVATTPGRQQFHPSAVKVWGRCGVAGDLESPSYNVSSVTDAGAGLATPIFTVSFSSGIYGSGGMLLEAASTNRYINCIGTAVGSVQLNSTIGNTGAQQDPATGYMWMICGDQ